MSTAPEAGHIPEWDMADRMRKTLRDSGASVASVADYFGVNRNTIGNWINGHITPDLTTQRLWAMRFGVPLEWLQTGATVPTPPDGKQTGYKSGRTGHLASMEDYVTAA